MNIEYLREFAALAENGNYLETAEELYMSQSTLSKHIMKMEKELGTRVDRHDSIGQGFLGLDFFKKIMQDPNLNHIPFILETPDESLWSQEITLLHELEQK